MTIHSVQTLTCDLHDAEKRAVQTMLLTALQHGFQLDELIKLTARYRTCVAVIECNRDHWLVKFASRDGYASRRFDTSQHQQAIDFAEQFDNWWYQ